VKAVGSAGDGSSLAVEALDAAVVDARTDVLEDAVAVGCDGLGELDERFEPGASSPGEPLVELGRGDVDLAAVEDGDEGLLEQIGSKEGLVGSLEGLELVALEPGEVPRVFLERPPSLLERFLVGGVGLPHFLASDLIDRVVSEALDVEPVEDELGVGTRFRDGLDVGAAEVERDGFELGAAFGAEMLEEGFERGRALALGGPDNLGSFMVDHHGDVLVVAPVAELVDADEA